ncbi:MAG TPA: protein kinase [Candidatus Ozemobacteraceae bacterium]|nr:protein kinase [Candidatus Ozemobacteraceae bacterium]
MGRVIPIGEPVNDAERQTIGFLRDHLPDSYLILHNFELGRDGERFEIDLAIIAPHAVYLVDIKSTHGTIDVHGPHWYPDGRAPFSSPLLKLRHHARALKGVITASHPHKPELERVYVTAAVILSAPTARLLDPENRDGPDVTTLARASSFFQQADRIPAIFDRNLLSLQNIILKAVQGAAKRRVGPLRFGNWEISEKLGGTDSFTEYRAYNIFAGRAAGSVRLRRYQADPYLPIEQREAQQRHISNAYQAINRLPSHPSIIGARDFFGSEAGDSYILVTEDAPGQALRLHLDQPARVLTFDQKRRIAADLLAALAHAHAHQVVHRNLTPSCILVRPDGGIALGGFDFARVGQDRSHSIAREIIEDLDERYAAPEVHREPQAASPASDVFSAGLILYELFTGERPFQNQSEVFSQGGVFAQKPSVLRSELNAAFDEWIQMLCRFEPGSRPSSSTALETFYQLVHPEQTPASEPAATPTPEPDYFNLPPNFPLSRKFVVQKRLGKPGSFGAVYKVIDTLGDVARAVKLILRDRTSVIERLKTEYRALVTLPEHPHVVKVFDADFLPGSQVPFIVFEYVDGLDVGEMIDEKCFSADDALLFARQTLAGLGHLHRNNIRHCDIKPRNLLWTGKGVKIIDFNVSVRTIAGNSHGGGTKRYLPPDLELSGEPTDLELRDRDLYAFGLTFFEVVTGRYPWDASIPPAGQPAPDPRTFSDCANLHPEVVAFLAKALASKRADRFHSTEEMEAALSRLASIQTSSSGALAGTTDTESLIQRMDLGEANANPFVDYLLTLFSQSTRSNRGTRGLDELGKKIYVETALDRELAPAVLAGQFDLVIITGNAGDGKTAFLQQMEDLARHKGGTIEEAFLNGSRFQLEGRWFQCLYDGSQDEGDKTSDDVLLAFFRSFAGAEIPRQSANETRLIAINEGRLVDFLLSAGDRFARLKQIVTQGLATGVPEERIAVVNLNLRSIVGDSVLGGQNGVGSILRRLMQRLVQPKLWEPCAACDLADRCYVLHNVHTFQDSTAGVKVLERLETLFTLTHLRGQLHVTMRDLRSALAFTLAGTRSCREIHVLYRSGSRDEVLAGFYFNSWMGGDRPISDRLIAVLAELDIGKAAEPQLDRRLDFLAPDESRHLFTFDRRARYDRELLESTFADLPRDCTSSRVVEVSAAHRRFVAMCRRRDYFERRDGGWRQLLPYHSADRMLTMIERRLIEPKLVSEILDGINRGEGVFHPSQLGGGLALQVRRVDNGTIRSYRLFPANRFSIALQDQSERAKFVEHVPRGLLLRYATEQTTNAELEINLDIFEMLHRLNAGYRPSLEEEQGYYLSLTVFKNVLAAAPYQEVLLTSTGHEFFVIRNLEADRLEMHRLERPKSVTQKRENGESSPCR